MEPVPPINQGQPSGLLNPNKIYQAQGVGNLMNPMRVVNIDEDKNSHGDRKSLILGVLGVFTAGIFGWSFARYLAADMSFWIVLAALFLWSAMSVLTGFLEKKIERRFLFAFLEALALVAFFWGYVWQALAIAWLLVLFCLMWGYFSVRRELRNTIEMRFFTASGKVIGKVITAAVIFMIIMYGSLSSDSGNFFVSQSGFNSFFGWASAFVNNFYPTVPLTGSFNDFAQAVARMQLEGNPQFQALSPSEQSTALTQSADSIVATFANQSSTAAISSTAEEPTNNAFYNYFTSLTAQLQNKFGTAFIGAWGLILFLIVRSIGIIAVWVAQLVALIFYEILLATGFMKIREQTTTKETIGY